MPNKIKLKAGDGGEIIEKQNEAKQSPNENSLLELWSNKTKKFRRNPWKNL